MKKIVVSLIISYIVLALLGAILVFYLDLANGPLVLFILELILLGALIAVIFILRKKGFWLRSIPWATFVVVNLIIVLCAHPSEIDIPANRSGKMIKTEVLSLKDGKVQGVYNKDQDVEIFAGIPYAKAPIGELRWKEPQDVEAWDDVRDSSYFAPKSMQEASNSVVNTAIDIYAMKKWVPNYNMEPVQKMSEDSLYLNILRTKEISEPLPILVYIHGGSLKSGTSANYTFDGETFAKRHVIMITVSYRLGVFGYFAHPSLKAESLNGTTGNYGLLDQIKALKWVNDNAEYFGGDKDNITIAGESAGSSSVSAICSSPLASGLFKSAIGESSSLVVKKAPHTYRTLEKAYEEGEKVFKDFKASSIEDLRKVPASKLVNTSSVNQEMTLDGYALTKDPYQVYLDNENNETNLLNGYNVLEADAFVIPGRLFSPTNKKNIRSRLIEGFNEETADKLMEVYKDRIEKDAFSVFNEIYSVYWFIYPHHSWSKMALNSNVNVYRYQFTKENGYYGTYHSGEIIYAYGNISKSNHLECYDESDDKLSDIMVSYWTNFARSGNPNGEGLPTWNKYESNGNVLELGSNVGPISDRYLNVYNILEEYIDSL